MILTCPSCGKKNRSPAERLAETGRCGACKTEISPVGKPLAVDPQSFREIVRDARVPVLVDFWADWCGPCKMVAPEVERTAAEMAGRGPRSQGRHRKPPGARRRVRRPGNPELRRAEGRAAASTSRPEPSRAPR